MARKKQTGPTHATEVEAALDEDLTYHVGMILSYTKRKPLETLHTKHQGDPIFEFFGMTSLEFTKKRWAAGFANSCATNLGRFAEKATTTMLSVAFGLTAPQLLKTLTITANEVVETEATDGVLLVDEVQPDSRDRLKKVASRLSKELSSPFDAKGIGFEIRGVATARTTTPFCKRTATWRRRFKRSGARSQCLRLSASITHPVFRN